MLNIKNDELSFNKLGLFTFNNFFYLLSGDYYYSGIDWIGGRLLTMILSLNFEILEECILTINKSKHM